MLLRLQELQMPELDPALSLRPETAVFVLLKARPVAAERALGDRRTASG
jgi:hypothetical protein